MCAAFGECFEKGGSGGSIDVNESKSKSSRVIPPPIYVSFCLVIRHEVSTGKGEACGALGERTSMVAIYISKLNEYLFTRIVFRLCAYFVM